MSRVEYKIEWVDLNSAIASSGGSAAGSSSSNTRGLSHEPRLAVLVERVNQLAVEGWRVTSVDLTPHPAFEIGPLPVMLEREITP